MTPEACESWMADVWNRLGMDPNDKSTWTAERTNMPHHRSIAAKEIAPTAWDAICELCGGVDRVNPDVSQWNDGFIVNLGSEKSEGIIVSLGLKLKGGC